VSEGQTTLADVSPDSFGGDIDHSEELANIFSNQEDGVQAAPSSRHSRECIYWKLCDRVGCSLH